MAVGGKVDFEVDGMACVGREEKCEICKMTHSDGYCSQCDMHVCQICFDNHLISRLCRDHVLVQNSHEENSHRNAIHFELCEEHTQQEVKVYCTEHKCCACIECILLHHKSCKWEYIAKASEEFQSSGELTRLLEEVQSIEYTLDTYLEDIDKHTETIEAVNIEVVSDIEAFANSLVEYVTTSKQQVLEDVKVRESTHQQRLAKLKEDVKSLGSQVKEIISDFRNENVLHKRFILAVETMSKVALIKRELSSIDFHNVITENMNTFRKSKLLTSMMSNARPIGRLVETENGEEDDDDIEVKTERERNHSLQQQLDAKQDEIVKLRKDLADVKQNYNNVVEENKTLQQEISTLKNCDKQFTVRLTGGPEHNTSSGTDKMLTVCGNINCDQPDGTFSNHIDGWNNIVMTFTFPKGTQSALNRNPGQPYSGKTEKSFLYNDDEGQALFSMMKLAFDRKCLFTVDGLGYIQSGVELWQSGWFHHFGKPIYQGYLARARKQLEAIGTCTSNQ